MIRTRDFLLFMLMFVCVLVGIGYTVARDMASTDVATARTDRFANLDAVQTLEQTSIVPAASTDKELRRRELQEKIAAGEGLILSAPPASDQNDLLVEVEESEDEAIIDGALDRAVQYCSGLLPSRISDTRWPRSAELVQVEGARVVQYEDQVRENIGTTTRLATTSKIIVQLPQFSPAPTASCIDVDIVGVTTSGEPIRNTDTWRFVQFNSTQLIGYALDGAPIYGVTQDTAALDECGGRMLSEYRYYLQASESYILSCFSGTPTTILE